MDPISFVTLFPQQAVAETRAITTRGHAVLPDDEYALVESYCPDPTCDCRRVMLNVLPRRRKGQGYLASISFGFDRDETLAGPFLDPLNPQSEYAEVFLDMVSRDVLSDPAYVARLETHYDQVKQAVANPTPAIRRILRRLRDEVAAPVTPRKTVRRNAPCPCGSGKKYKHCCMRKDRGKNRAMPQINRLIQQLIQSRDQPHPDLLADILACGEAAVEPLIAIIRDPKMYRNEVRGRPRLLPEYAMGLLGDLRAEAAVPTLIELLTWTGMDVLLERVVATLVRIGPAAVEPAKAVVLDRSLPWNPRSMAAMALVAQVYKDPEGSKALLEFLRDLLRHGPVKNPDDKIVYTLLAQDLADLQNLDALDVIQAAFQRGAIDEAYLDWPDAETICRNPAPYLLQRYTTDFLPDYRASRFTGETYGR